ncbi:sugar ABC transporter permease [Bifidobacterium scardovii]|nr:sugar ABC transporter permease [Bifidobacterium scardovii]MDU5298084.1 sugar ABC transporter permease [Bifidobacterium scardovii]MDU5888121.1 sugar ABC transporter permease [Bifidobacterium scardovii]
MRDFAKRYWTVLPAIILLCVFMVGPILWAFYGSMTNMSLTGATATDTSFIGLENYQKLFTDKSFPQSVWLTVIFVLISAIIAQNFLGMAVAVLLSRANRTVGQFVSVSVISAWVLPEMVAGFACYAFFSKNGTLNQVLGLFGLGNTEWLYTFPMFAVILANI